MKEFLPLPNNWQDKLNKMKHFWRGSDYTFLPDPTVLNASFTCKR